MRLLYFVLSPPGLNVFVRTQQDWEKEKRKDATPHLLMVSFLTTACPGAEGAVALHESLP